MKIKGLTDTQVKILTDYMIEYFGAGPDGEEFSEIKTFGDVKEFFLFSGDSKEELNSDYLTTTYYIKTNGIKFCIDYSQYRKDGGLCDGDWDKEFYVIEPKVKKIKNKK